MIRHTPTAPLRRAAQQGMVLLMALIVLVAIMVAGIAMIRSVDTATLVSGNLAFQQAATYASDKGVEAAIAMIKDRRTQGTLGDNDPTNGYYASFVDSSPAANSNWPQFWSDHFAGDTVSVQLPVDQFQNQVSYVVHRQCKQGGTGGDAGCVKTWPKGGSGTGGGFDADGGGGNAPIEGVSQTYYRVTVRVSGPRRTESYVQTIVAM